MALEAFLSGEGEKKFCFVPDRLLASGLITRGNVLRLATGTLLVHI